LTNEELAADSSQLAQCVAALAERLQAGEQVDIGELCADCPEYVEQLEMLLPTLEAIVDLEHSLDRDGADGLDSSATAALPLPGVLGDFRIVREIGRGGMGVVYEAQQISLNRRVALKVLPFAAMLESRRLERFRHEAQAAAMLRHPHIVTVYSVGCERGVHYYAMDLVEGPSLAEVVEALRAESVGQRAGISGVEQQRISGVGEKATDYSTSPLLRYRSSVDQSTPKPPPPSRRFAPRSPPNTSARSPDLASRPPKRSTTPTSLVLCIAISSRRIYCSSVAISLREMKYRKLKPPIQNLITSKIGRGGRSVMSTLPNSGSPISVWR
jgi:hypothetical protein